MKSVAVMLGHAFDAGTLGGGRLEPVEIETRWGPQEVYRFERADRPAYVVFRHGLHDHLLPHQVTGRAQVEALKKLDCGALLVSSAVDVLDLQIPLHRPMLLSDLIMPGNRLPDGSACTFFTDPSGGHGHLVIEEGLMSARLAGRLRALAGEVNVELGPEPVFTHVPGPRTCTAAEARMWARFGAQVMAMTVAPEVILANEREIPTVALVIGQEYALPELRTSTDPSKGDARARGRESVERLVVGFLRKAEPVEFANRLHRSSGPM